MNLCPSCRHHNIPERTLCKQCRAVLPSFPIPPYGVSRWVYGIALAWINLGLALWWGLLHGISLVAAMPGIDELPSTAGLMLLIVSIMTGIRLLPWWLGASALVMIALVCVFRCHFLIRFTVGVCLGVLGALLVYWRVQPDLFTSDILRTAGMTGLWYGIVNVALTWRLRSAAIQARQPEPDLIHHSDRGVQYASGAYIARLTAIGAQISMSAKGNPYDNAKVESFLRHSNGRRSISTNTRHSPMPKRRLAASLTMSIIKSGCTHASATCRRVSLKGFTMQTRSTHLKWSGKMGSLHPRLWLRSFA
jgi:hypothetical protein